MFRFTADRQRSAYVKMWRDAERNRRRLLGQPWYRCYLDEGWGWLGSKVPLIIVVLMIAWVVFSVVLGLII